MYKPSSTTYDYIWGAFFSSCSGNGTKDHSTQPALKAVSCTDIATGAGGHRYGLSSRPAASAGKIGTITKIIQIAKNSQYTFSLLPLFSS